MQQGFSLASNRHVGHEVMMGCAEAALGPAVIPRYTILCTCLVWFFWKPHLPIRTCLLGPGHGTSERASVHGTRAAPRAPERKQAGKAGWMEKFLPILASDGLHE